MRYKAAHQPENRVMNHEQNQICSWQTMYKRGKIKDGPWIIRGMEVRGLEGLSVTFVMVELMSALIQYWNPNHYTKTQKPWWDLSKIILYSNSLQSTNTSKLSAISMIDRRPTLKTAWYMPTCIIHSIHWDWDIVATVRYIMWHYAVCLLASISYFLVSSRLGLFPPSSINLMDHLTQNTSYRIAYRGNTCSVIPVQDGQTRGISKGALHFSYWAHL